jgi:aminoglycoside phosphotransferase (APT) family kinase protein
MHADQVDTDVELARRLVASQFPEWASLPVEVVTARGTDNALYRLGADKVVRLPTRPRTSLTLEKERRWLPRLAPFLPLAVPTPLAEGAPDEVYPFAWSVYGWLPGKAAAEEPIADLRQAAADLAGFIAALQRVDPAGGPPPGEHNFGRGEPLVNREEPMRAALESLREEPDVDAVAAIWGDALAAPNWSRPPVWIHGDLDSRNLLVENGRLSAVIDFGSLGVGDPACEVMAAWKLFTGESRDLFRDALAVDDATWVRARGWAVSQAVIALAYYTPETNPVLVREAQKWLEEVLADA